MTDHPPVSPEVAELREEQALEAAHVANMRAATERAHLAAAFHIESKAHVLNALAWLIAVATIVGAVYVALVLL